MSEDVGSSNCDAVGFVSNGLEVTLLSPPSGVDANIAIEVKWEEAAERGRLRVG